MNDLDILTDSVTSEKESELQKKCEESINESE